MNEIQLRREADIRFIEWNEEEGEYLPDFDE